MCSIVQLRFPPGAQIPSTRLGNVRLRAKLVPYLEEMALAARITAGQLVFFDAKKNPFILGFNWRIIFTGNPRRAELVSASIVHTLGPGDLV